MGEGGEEEEGCRDGGEVESWEEIRGGRRKGREETCVALHLCKCTILTGILEMKTSREAESI